MRHPPAILIAAVSMLSTAYAQEGLDARCVAAAQRLLPSMFSGAMPDVAPLSEIEFLTRVTDLANTTDEVSQKNPGLWVESNRLMLQSGDAKARYDIRLTDVQGGVAIQRDGLQIRCQVTFGTSLTYSFTRPAWGTGFTERDIDVAARAAEDPNSVFGEMIRSVRRASYADKMKAAQAVLGKDAIDRLRSTRSVSEVAKPTIKFEFKTAGGAGNETILASNIHSTYLTAAMKTARAAATNESVLVTDFDRWAEALWQRISARSPAERTAAAQRKVEAERAVSERDDRARRQAIEVIGQQVNRCYDEVPLSLVVVRIRLSTDGSLNGPPEVISGHDSPSAAAIVRAVRRCSPLRIPVSLAASYDIWKTTHLRFAP